MAADQQMASKEVPARVGYSLAILTAVSFFSYLDRMVVSVVLEPIKRELLLTDAQMGVVAGLAFAVMYATMGVPLARIADSRSRVKLLAICLGSWSAMTALTGVARSYIEMVLTRMVVGAGEAGCIPTSHSLIGDLYPPERRVMAICIFQAGGLAGMSAGLALTGIIAGMWGWRASLIVTGMLGIPLALLVLTMREPARQGPSQATTAEPTMTALRVLLRRRPLVHLILAVSIGAFGTLAVSQWLPAYYIRIHHLSVAEVGFLNGVTTAIGGIIGTLFGGYMVLRIGRRDKRWELWWPMVMFVLGVPLWVAVFTVADWRLALSIQAVAAFLWSSTGGVALSAVQTYVEPHRRATAIALLYMLSSLLGLGLGPVLVGVTSDVLAHAYGSDGLRYAMVGAALLPLWAAVHFGLAARSSQSVSI